MSITKFSSEEFIDLMVAKVVNGKVALQSIKKILNNDRFPDSLSKNAIEKLKEYSEAYRRFENYDNSFIKQIEETIASSRKFITSMTEEKDLLENTIRDEIGERKLGFIKSKMIMDKLNRDVNGLQRSIEKMKTDYEKLYLIFNKVKQE